MLATSSLIESCTREYRDWMEERPTPEGDERPALEEHFVWLSKDYTPHDTDLDSPFVPPGFHFGITIRKGLAPSGQGAPLDPGSGEMPQTSP